MQRTPRILLVAVLAAAPLLAACGDDDTADPPSSTSPSGGGGSEVTVGATDQLKFDAESYEAEAGEVTFHYENEGSVAHTLLIKDVDGFKLEMGPSDEGSVEREAGEYTLYCDVAGHEAAGMVADLTVS